MLWSAYKKFYIFVSYVIIINSSFIRILYFYDQCRIFVITVILYLFSGLLPVHFHLHIFILFIAFLIDFLTAFSTFHNRIQVVFTALNGASLC